MYAVLYCTQANTQPKQQFTIHLDIEDTVAVISGIYLQYLQQLCYRYRIVDVYVKALRRCS